LLQTVVCFETAVRGGSGSTTSMSSLPPAR